LEFYLKFHTSRKRKTKFLFFFGTRCLAEFADIIIPTTKSSAGAKAAGLGTLFP
jgi:hypothetical protein